MFVDVQDLEWEIKWGGVGVSKNTVVKFYRKWISEQYRLMASVLLSSTLKVP